MLTDLNYMRIPPHVDIFYSMAFNKLELYSSLWASCGELRGGMEALLYKYCVLFFVKHVSDRYVGMLFTSIAPQEGYSFIEMVTLKGKTRLV